MSKNKKEKSRQWDGRSRPSTDLYSKNFDAIFKKGVVNTKTKVKDLKKIMDEDYFNSKSNKELLDEMDKEQNES